MRCLDCKILMVRFDLATSHLLQVVLLELFVGAVTTLSLGELKR